MAFNFLKDGMNTVIDEVTDTFNLDDIFPESELETGAPRKFPRNLDAHEFGGLKIEFKAYQNQGIRLGEKLGGDVASSLGGSDAVNISKDILNDGFSADKGFKLTKDIAGTAENLLGKVVDTGIQVGKDVWETAQGVLKRDPATGQTMSLATAKGLTEIGAWQLFLPQTISTKYSASWSQTELQFLGKALDTATSYIPGGAQGTNAAKLLNGQTLNPVSEMLFQGIGHRSFSYSFSLCPKNEQESRDAQDLIKFFKTNSAPAIAPNTMAMVLNYPNYFGIRYLWKGEDSPWINKIAYCVMTGFDVKYHEMTPSFHRDGSPTSMVVSMDFTEIEPIYRDMMCKGNY